MNEPAADPPVQRSNPIELVCYQTICARDQRLRPRLALGQVVSFGRSIAPSVSGVIISTRSVDAARSSYPLPSFQRSGLMPVAFDFMPLGLCD